MKILLLWLSITNLVCAADTNYLHAADVLKSDGVLLICDGSSYYAFKADGTFRSFPRGMSGRVFDGTWKKTDENPLKLEVTAKMSWANGEQPQDDYRRIVFFVYGGGKRAMEKSDFGAYGYKEIFQGYFIIDELTKIPKPDK